APVHAVLLTSATAQYRMRRKTCKLDANCGAIIIIGIGAVIGFPALLIAGPGLRFSLTAVGDVFHLKTIHRPLGRRNDCALCNLLTTSNCNFRTVNRGAYRAIFGSYLLYTQGPGILRERDGG